MSALVPISKLFDVLHGAMPNPVSLSGLATDHVEMPMLPVLTALTVGKVAEQERGRAILRQLFALRYREGPRGGFDPAPQPFDANKVIEMSEALRIDIVTKVMRQVKIQEVILIA
jgi:hypothetical protein